MQANQAPFRLDEPELVKLRRWNTPSVYNGWESISGIDRLQAVINRDETRDFMPSLGPMVGRAITVRIETTNARRLKDHASAWDDWLAFVARFPGPKIVVMKDTDAASGLGSFWGEVSANTHRSIGCVGAIVDGAIRDVDEMTSAGFKALARRLCVGHLYAWPVDWGEPVEVFGARVETGMLMHADKHGFIGIPQEDEQHLLSAVRALDDAECETVIPAGQFTWGLDLPSLLKNRNAAALLYRAKTSGKGRTSGEW